MNNLIFWQYMPNIHEAGYIKALSQMGFACTVVHQVDLLTDRARLGVTMPDYGSARVFLCTKDMALPIEALKCESTDVHFMTGIRAFNLTSRAFNEIKSSVAKIYLISESRDPRGLKGILRYLHSWIFEIEIRHRITGVFAMGQLGVSWFVRTGYDPKKVIPFCYSINTLELTNNINLASIAKPEIAFVGQFIDRKNPSLVIRALKKITNVNVICHFFGDGPMLKVIKKIVANHNFKHELIFHGPISNDELIQKLTRIDILVLPSKWDGWGAVVNEAFSAGCKCVVSDRCGASVAVQSRTGSVFKWNFVDDFAAKLEEQLLECPLTPSRRKEIVDWSKRFSGMAVANYLLCFIGLSNLTRGDTELPFVPRPNGQSIALVYHNLPHYRQGFIDEFIKTGDSITLLSDDASEFNGIPSAKSLSGLRQIVVKNFWIGRFLVQPKVIWYALTARDSVFIFLANPNFLSTWIAAAIVRMRNKHVVFWGHGYLRPNQRIKNIFRDAFYLLANSFYCYGVRAKKIAVRRGFKPARWYVGFNSLLYLSQINLRNELLNQRQRGWNSSDSSINVLRILCVSRLTPACNYELLIEAISIARQQCALNFELIFIGDGPSRGSIEEEARRRNVKICFAGAIYDERVVSKYIFDSDVVVAPGKVGLTAIHSLTYGTPVITHSSFDDQMPEVEAIVDKKTGLLFKKDDALDLASKLCVFKSVFSDRLAVRRNCFSVVDYIYNPKNQIKILYQAIIGTPADSGESISEMFTISEGDIE